MTCEFCEEPHAHARRADEFRPGQRVQLSETAKRHNMTLQMRAGDRGTVVKIKPSFMVKVHPDHYQGSTWFASYFWKPLEEVKG